MNRFDDYPLVQRALDELTQFYQGETGEGPPEDLLKITYRTLEILDKCLPYARDDRESLMAAAVLIDGPPDFLQPVERLGRDYDARVQKIVETWLTEPDLKRDMTDLAQVHSALYTSYCEDLLERVKTSTKAQAFWLEGVRERMEDHLKSRQTVEGAVHPALDALELNAVRAVLAAVNSILRPPRPPRAPGLR